MDDDHDLLSIRCPEPDEAEHVGSEIYFPHRLTVLEHDRPFAMELRAMKFGPVMVGVLRYNSEVLIETDDLETSYEINIPLRGRVLSRSGAHEVAADPTTAAVFRPWGATSFRGFAGGGTLVGLKVDRQALERHYAELTHAEALRPVALGHSLYLGDGPGHDWWQIARALVDLIDRPTGLAANKLVTRPLAQSTLTGLLFALDHPGLGRLLEAPVKVAPRAVRTAIDLLEEQPDVAWTVPDLARRSAMSVRSLQEGFRQATGQNPTEYLRAVRLRRAHAELVFGDPATTSVAEVATKWGFGHLGRFAAAYRQVYRTAPSATLRAV